MSIPAQILRQLYRFGSLANAAEGVRFELKNRLLEVRVTRVHAVRINGREVPLERIRIRVGDGPVLAAGDVAEDGGLAFPLGAKLAVELDRLHLDDGRHEIELDFEVAGFGRLSLATEDVLSVSEPERVHVPHDERDDYSQDLVASRQRFVEEHTGVTLEHVGAYSFEPSRARGNIENFTGVAQVPLGFAGPIRIDGEHARGDVLVPMATTEGTLLASYTRGIKVVNLSGGARCTVAGGAMQRAPVFIFDSAREARDFARWVDNHRAEIKQAAEATSRHAELVHIEHYLSNKFTFLRFNFTTGDAAGQNMVGRATFAACQWILEKADDVRGFYLEANLATDKKHSQLNILHTRGKRVTAEVTIPRDVLLHHMRVAPEALHDHARIGTIGSILSGASNNGAHSSNGITAMFIATGQDVANIAESSAGLLYTELTRGGDLYVSLTIPSLIVGTYGGGTGLPTQSECLRALGCTGRGSADKLAEIFGGVALAGEISLGAAISSLDWVAAHERLGRHR